MADVLLGVILVTNSSCIQVNTVESVWAG